MLRVFLLLCSILGASAFEIGRSYKYSYTTTLQLDERCEESGAALGHRVTSRVKLTAVWASEEKKLIKVELLDTHLLVPVKSQFQERKTVDSNHLQSKPFFVLLVKRSPEHVWDSPDDPGVMRNLKRGIASLLHFSETDREGKEKDVSGVCDVIYNVNKNTIKRRKGNCIHSKFDRTLSQTHGVRSAATDHLSAAECEWSAAAVLSTCVVTEHARLFSNAWHRPSLCVQTKTELLLEGTDKNSDVYDNKDLESVIEELKKTQELEQSDLESILGDTNEKPVKRQLKASIAKLESDLKTEHLAELRSATAFYKLLPAFRAATSGEILQVLNNKKLKDIIPQLLDLVSACATENCLKAVFEFFEREDEYNLTLERFLISLSILPRPNAMLLQKLKSFLELREREERIEATLLTTMGTLVKAYSENPVTANDEIIEDIRKFLESRLEKCDKEDEDCEINHLRSLRNAALSRSVPLLLRYTIRGGRETMEALLALKNIPPRLLTPETPFHLLRVFNQVGTRQDRSARAVALEMLLKLSPKMEVLKDLLYALKDQEDEESATFLSSKILYAMSQDSHLKSNIYKLLSDKDINYYHTLAQKGQSSLFRRPMISVQGTNVTFGLENEFLTGGMLKRAVFDVSFQNQAEGDSTLLSVGVFAAGLGALAGGGDSSAEDVSSPTAGLNLGFLNSALRPYIFFRSTSELMGHAWSGTASELTPVLQGILMFSDDERIVVLNNGMPARAQLRGALSVNGAASVQISLWNRNSQSLIKNEGALIVRGAITVDAGFVVTQGTLQFTGASGVDFKIDLDFYEAPFMTCLQMEHPPVSINSDVHRTVSIPGSKYHLKKSKKRTLSIPGRSFAFNERNNAMCAQLKSADES